MKNNHNSHFENMVVSCQDFYPGIRWISTLDFVERRNEREWHIVDVRSDEERAVSMIPGSIAISVYQDKIG